MLGRHRYSPYQTETKRQTKEAGDKTSDCQFGKPAVAVHPSEILRQSGSTVVNGTLGPLAATEAHLFDAIVGDLGTLDGGI